MKKLLTVSLLAMMAVGTARADIASTGYADTAAANAQSAAISAAAADATTKANTAESNAKTAASEALAAAKTELEGKITAETTRATAAETVLGTRIDNISAGELTIKEGAVTAKEIKDGEVKTDEIAVSAVTTAKIADENVTKAKLSEGVQASLDKADAAAPQSTTYTKAEVNAKISNDGVADAAAQKETAPSIEYAQAMIDASQADLEDDVEDLQGKVGDTAVSEQIAAAVEELAGTDKTGTVDGSYVVAVAQENGKITSETVAFDDSLSATSKNAVQNKVVDAAIKAEATRATAAEATKVAKDDLGIGSSFNIPDTCKAEDAVCSLVVRAGVAGWEAVTY